MDTYTCIISKRDTRSYVEKPIPTEALGRILQAGRMAGSAKNSQLCRFVLLEERARKQELAGCGQFAAHIPSAAVVVAIVMPKEGRDFDAGRAAQNMMLAAWAEGIASCPVGIQDVACGRASLGTPPDYEVAMVLTMGYPVPGQPLSRGQKRLTLGELVHLDRW